MKTTFKEPSVSIFLILYESALNVHNRTLHRPTTGLANLVLLNQTSDVTSWEVRIRSMCYVAFGHRI